MSQNHGIDKVLRRQLIRSGARIGFLCFAANQLAVSAPKHSTAAYPKHLIYLRFYSTATPAPLCEKEEFALRLPRPKVTKWADGTRRRMGVARGVSTLAAPDEEEDELDKLDAVWHNEAPWPSHVDQDFEPERQGPTESQERKATKRTGSTKDETFFDSAVPKETEQARRQAEHEAAIARLSPTEQTIHHLSTAVLAHLYNPNTSSVDNVHALYLDLPQPRMSHLPTKMQQDLMHVMGRGKKTQRGMIRYFDLMNDLRAVGAKPRAQEYNAAISYVARYVGTSTAVELTEALEQWKEMEHEAGIEGDSVTFSILFDVASKAGNFTLAELLYDEMRKRSLPFNRFHSVSLIHYEGLKGNSTGIRTAYQAMVDAGEMIDTVVLNCVIAGFLRCGDEHEAGRIYERMKAAYASTPDMAKQNYFDQRLITKILMMFAKVGGQSSDMLSSLQAQSPIAPNLATYRILLNHYAVKLGDLSKVAELLDNMVWFHIPLHGTVFVALFKGFGLYGNDRADDWNEKRLNSVWKAFKRAFDDGTTHLTIQTWLAMAVLSAYRACSSEDKVRRVFVELSSRWDLSHDGEEFMHRYLKMLLNTHGSPMNRKQVLPGFGRGLVM